MRPARSMSLPMSTRAGTKCARTRPRCNNGQPLNRLVPSEDAAAAVERVCLVATLPDPIDSHLQLTFDAALAAITRAFEQHGYVLDRFSLPWSDELRQRPLTGRPDRQKYKQPGAVLFRKARETREFDKGDTCDLIMLRLVGEYVGIELNPDYVKLAVERIHNTERLLFTDSPIALGPGLPHPGPRPPGLGGPSFAASARVTYHGDS